MQYIIRLAFPRGIVNPQSRAPGNAFGRAVCDTVSELLRSWTRNPMGFTRRRSNPRCRRALDLAFCAIDWCLLLPRGDPWRVCCVFQQTYTTQSAKCKNNFHIILAPSQKYAYETKKHPDTEGIRTPAGAAHCVSSPAPEPLGHCVPEAKGASANYNARSRDGMPLAGSSTTLEILPHYANLAS